MSNKKTKKLTSTQTQYQTFAKAREPSRPIVKNCFRAFLVGGIICTLGQTIQKVSITYFHLKEEMASNFTVAILIIISILLTTIGLYDRIAQWAGAGTAVPITGFANTMSSAALEHRSEGFVLGVGGNMFKLAGPVIVFGVFSAFIVSIIRIILKSFGAV